MQTEIAFTAFLAYVQTLPGGEFLVATISYGVMIAAVLVLIGLALVVRGWISWFFSSEQDRQRMHDGNPAFAMNQKLFVMPAFALAFGSTLVGSLSVNIFLRKLAIAFIVQIVAMLVVRVLFAGDHRRMYAGNVSAAISLGMITLTVGVVTMFGMMR
ncbi:MAG: hypothetical protein WA021_01830 [Minisyncoccia bacterium]